MSIPENKMSTTTTAAAATTNDTFPSTKSNGHLRTSFSCIPAYSVAHHRELEDKLRKLNDVHSFSMQPKIQSHFDSAKAEMEKQRSMQTPVDCRPEMKPYIGPVNDVVIFKKPMPLLKKKTREMNVPDKGTPSLLKRTIKKENIQLSPTLLKKSQNPLSSSSFLRELSSKSSSGSSFGSSSASSCWESIFQKNLRGIPTSTSAMQSPSVYSLAKKEVNSLPGFKTTNLTTTSMKNSCILSPAEFAQLFSK